MKITFLGLGNMGSAIANVSAKNSYNVLGWDYNANVVNEINAHSRNSAYLEGVTLNKNLRATSNINEAALWGEIVFVALPSKFIENTLAPLKDVINKNQIIVNLSKGINKTTKQTSVELIKNIFPENDIVMLAGPAIANEIALEMPTAVVLASQNQEVSKKVAQVLNNAYFKTVLSQDYLGAELSGILKNIYAVGLGIIDGLNITSVNFRSVYYTLALREIASVVGAFGGDEKTVYHVSGAGDLFATCLSVHSHNRHFGELISRGMKLEQIKEEIKLLPEGYNTLHTFLEIAAQKNINFELAKSIACVVEDVLCSKEFVNKIINLV
ncbi:MAG: NAD(P)H-dependent glycerol-3-phosphate dehydrogenase [Elusimicrobia bacterium]|nr:NAD(P)H-dependent glycerol-3-phosphate dehydrogenase [Elusimicrobiota bacterium]